MGFLTRRELNMALARKMGYPVVDVKLFPIEDAALKKMITEGVAELDAQAKRRFGSSYAAIAKEADRVSVLKGIEQSPFFQKIRGDMVTGLYDNKQVWPMLGYEGSSWQKGGYVNRGFNDINWL